MPKNREDFTSVDLQYLESFVPSGGSEHFFAVSGMVRAGAVAVCRTYAFSNTSSTARFATSHPELAGHFLSISSHKKPKTAVPGVLPSTEVMSRPCTQPRRGTNGAFFRAERFSLDKCNEIAPGNGFNSYTFGVFPRYNQLYSSMDG